MFTAARRTCLALCVATALTGAAGAGPARAESPQDCAQGTVINVVAHEDDDLLFLNPDIQHDIDAGLCVTTIYLTAGDGAGPIEDAKPLYWRDGRETGELAAYAAMAGVGMDWYETDAGVPGQPIQAVDNSEGPRLRLVFLRLKDGGGGAAGSLEHGWNDAQTRMPVLYDDTHPERGDQVYSPDDLVEILGALYNQATNLVEIRTQDDRQEALASDHVDHVYGARFAGQAANLHAPSVPLVRYRDYEIQDLDQNVFGDDNLRKRDAFYNYAIHDSGICADPTTLDTCEATLIADNAVLIPLWLPKQYPVQ